MSNKGGYKIVSLAGWSGDPKGEGGAFVDIGVVDVLKNNPYKKSIMLTDAPYETETTGVYDTLPDIFANVDYIENDPTLGADCYAISVVATNHRHVYKIGVDESEDVPGKVLLVIEEGAGFTTLPAYDTTNYGDVLGIDSDGNLEWVTLE